MASSDNDELSFIDIEDGDQKESISLADLAGLDLDKFEEKHQFSYPRGLFTWEVAMEEDNYPRLIANNGKAAAVFNLTCIEVHSVNPQDRDLVPGGDNDKLIGKRHREAIFIRKLEDVGWVKAMIKAMGGGTTGTIKDQLRSTGGLRFIAPIIKRTDRQDSDKKYTNIDREKIKKLPGQSQVTPGDWNKPAEVRSGTAA